MIRVLIISPYFPPANTADSQRVRMSLSFFQNFGWEAEVVCVDEKYYETTKDELLLQSIPAETVIHHVKAFSRKWTSKFGLGSLALRSLWFYRKKVMLLLQAKNYDLVYFSTTEFSLCVLGRYWKKYYKIPYVIDMQDAWHSTYYQNKSKNERPKKHWFSYRLHKYLEPFAMKKCDGLISVSAAYLDTLRQRYLQLEQKPSAVIPFGAFAQDFEIAKNNIDKCPAVNLSPQKINVIYVGRGGADLQFSVELLFSAIKEALQTEPGIFSRFHFYFIGTSYAPKTLAKPSIAPIAQKFGIEKSVTEITDRIGFYSTINTLLAADALFLPGSDDPEYSASKIYPYLMAEKPLLALVNPESNAKLILEEYGVKNMLTYDKATTSAVTDFLRKLIGSNHQIAAYDTSIIDKYTAKNMTMKQCLLFDKVVAKEI